MSSVREELLASFRASLAEAASLVKLYEKMLQTYTLVERQRTGLELALSIQKSQKILYQRLIDENT